jgi:hypothetical protein
MAALWKPHLDAVRQNANMLIWLCALFLLWIVPVLTYRWASHAKPSHTFCFAGIALGAVASPASMGTYGLFWLAGNIGLIALPLAFIGILGLPLALLHGVPGFYLATTLGLTGPEAAAHGIATVYIESLNAVSWAIVYGLIGCSLDFLIQRRRIRNSKLPNEPTESVVSVSGS